MSFVNFHESKNLTLDFTLHFKLKYNYNCYKITIFIRTLLLVRKRNMNAVKTLAKVSVYTPNTQTVDQQHFCRTEFRSCPCDN